MDFTSGFQDFQLEMVTASQADWALRGVRSARKTLWAGFTTVRDLHSFGFADVALKRASEAGWIEAPRIFPSGYPLTTTGGAGDAWGFAPAVLHWGPEEGVADGVDEIRKAVRYQVKHGAKVIKVYATAAVLSYEATPGAQQYSEEELQAVVEEASRKGVKVAAHAHGTEGIIAAVTAGVASIEHGSILTEEASRLMKEHGTYLIPNMYLKEVSDPSKLPEPLRSKKIYIDRVAEESFQLALRMGVKIAFGTDSSVYPHGENAKEFAARVKRGMKPIEAIRRRYGVCSRSLRCSGPWRYSTWSPC